MSCVSKSLKDTTTTSCSQYVWIFFISYILLVLDIITHNIGYISNISIYWSCVLFLCTQLSMYDIVYVIIVTPPWVFFFPLHYQVYAINTIYGRIHASLSSVPSYCIMGHSSCYWSTYKICFQIFKYNSPCKGLGKVLLTFNYITCTMHIILLNISFSIMFWRIWSVMLFIV